jgi:uncharacterized protein YqhQ
MDNFILKSFRDQVQRSIDNRTKIKNYIKSFILLICLIAFVYIVSKQFSLAKYFFS